jgi:hypothetical protein
MFTMKIEKFQLRGNDSVCSGAFQLLRGRTSAQLRGNIDNCVIICIIIILYN